MARSMTEKILTTLIHRYGSRDALAVVLGTSSTAIYFWQLRDSIPEAWHGKLIALAEDDYYPEDIIPNLKQILETSREMKRVNSRLSK